MPEFEETVALPPFETLFGLPAPSPDALDRMIEIAVDPSTPDPGDGLIPDDSAATADADIDLSDFSDSPESAETESTESIDAAEELPLDDDSPADPFTDPLAEPTDSTDSTDPIFGVEDDPGYGEPADPDDPLADF